ncbi:MAG: carboxypeptidase-like regulatory domain-containing protein [Ferruginibacter sp.]
MKKICLILSFYFFTAAAIGQTGSFIISGKVIMADTKLPLQGASVFAQNTTFGTATDAEGNFRLWLPAGGYDIVLTYTGYSTESRRVSSSEKNEELLFELRLKEKELQAVSIISSNEVKDGWQKYGSFFEEQFIGKTLNSRQCEILNKDVLKFYFSKKRNRLKILANEPLLIENKALGYKITYALDSFTHEFGPQVSLYTGYPLFEQIPAASLDQQAAWDTARKIAYKGSILHFMRSLYNKQLKEEGFEIQFMVKINDNDKALKLKDFYGAMNYNKDDSTQTVEVKPNQKDVGIIYAREKPSKDFIDSHPDEPSLFQFSVLSFLPAESIIIEQNGYYFEQNELTIHAYWTWEKIADLLPYDFTAY